MYPFPTSKYTSFLLKCSIFAAKNSRYFQWCCWTPSASPSSSSSGQTEVISSQQRAADKSSDLTFLHFFFPNVQLSSGIRLSIFLVLLTSLPTSILVGWTSLMWHWCVMIPNSKSLLQQCRNHNLMPREVWWILVKNVLKMSNVLWCEQISSSSWIWDEMETFSSQRQSL